MPLFFPDALALRLPPSVTAEGCAPTVPLSRGESLSFRSSWAFPQKRIVDAGLSLRSSHGLSNTDKSVMSLVCPRCQASFRFARLGQAPWVFLVDLPWPVAASGGFCKDLFPSLCGGGEPCALSDGGRIRSVFGYRIISSPLRVEASESLVDWQGVPPCWRSQVPDAILYGYVQC